MSRFLVEGDVVGCTGFEGVLVGAKYADMQALWGLFEARREAEFIVLAYDGEDADTLAEIHVRLSLIERKISAIERQDTWFGKFECCRNGLAIGEHSIAVYDNDSAYHNFCMERWELSAEEALENLWAMENQGDIDNAMRPVVNFEFDDEDLYEARNWDGRYDTPAPYDS